jgi:hypothetical protein
MAIADMIYKKAQSDEEKKQQELPPTVEGCPPFGQLIPLSPGEREQLKSLRGLVRGFLRQRVHGRPLCLGVFGPPGSGKSFAVKQIRAEARGKSDPSVPMTTINLTQLASPAELSRAVATALLGVSSDAIPLFFFDEFDTARDGARYGWLSWFLSPMHDGEFIYEGKIIPVKRAILVFAGGTADTMEEFSARRGDPTFRHAKGPDFVSRLRGYLDVAGPNAPRSTLRRAFVLRSEFQTLADRRAPKGFRPSRELLESMLKAGRYRHGARSIAALIELSQLKGKLFDWRALPKDALIAMQVDRGPLDRRIIGGPIALSGFADWDNDGESRPGSIIRAWNAVVEALLKQGATLAFAGGWNNNTANLTGFVIDQLRRLPPELSAKDRVRERPSTRFMSFLRCVEGDEKRPIRLSVTEQRRLGVELVRASRLTGKEGTSGKWERRVVERFRRRFAVSESSVARFVAGGNAPRTKDRGSGVVEETILSLALGRPVYVVGGFGGAAKDLGVALGLDGRRTAIVPRSLRDRLSPEKRESLMNILMHLRPPPLPRLPVFPDEQVAFLHKYAIGGSLWPDNGLTFAQNRQLFAMKKPSDAAELIVHGLTTRFARANGSSAASESEEQPARGTSAMV